jgi:aminodeoxyfutalosine synthase
MTTMNQPYERFSERIAAGERLTRDEIEQLAATDDILAVGMLADEARRRALGTRVTFVRVATCAYDKPLAEAVPPSAREIRLTGTPPSLEVALTAVQAAKAIAGNRHVSGFSIVELQALAESSGQSLKSLLQKLREAGLDAPAEIPVDKLSSPVTVVEALAAADYSHVRLTMAKPAADERVAALLRAAELRDKYPIVATISPLPMSLAAFRPTTGYEDVKAVALARLAAVPDTHIQVDWQRYGPKLAQVALTFGADDIDNVSPSDEAPDGRRRAPLEEVRRNIEAAGFEPAERD